MHNFLRTESPHRYTPTGKCRTVGRFIWWVGREGGGGEQKCRPPWLADDEKHPKAVPKKRNLDQNINVSKISYLQFFFWKYYFGHTKFLYLSRRSSGYHWVGQQKMAKKITHFTIQFCSKILTHSKNLNLLDIENKMLPQHSQKSFWLYKSVKSKYVSVWCQKKYLYRTISWYPRTAFLEHIESKCLYISIYPLKKIFVSET